MNAMLTFALFRRLVHRPLADLLRAYDEERSRHARVLEERVREATAELAYRNEQLRQRNVELYETQRRLGQLERLAAAGQLAAQFAHEVGTPLNLISGHVQLLRRTVVDPRDAKRLEMVGEQITRIERIVRCMLDQTRRPTASRARVDLGAFFSRLFDTVAPTLAARGVTCEVAVEPGLPAALANADQLQQIFLNLVNNSLDAMPDGGRLAVRARRDGELARIELADTGGGIPQKDLRRVFEPLFTTKDRERGTGLGLAVAREIVEEHGGRIAVASEVGRGATFTVTLPLAPAPEDAGVAAEALESTP